MAGAEPDHLLERYEREKDLQVKTALIESLARSDSDKATDFLIAQLHAPEPSVRVSSIRGLTLRTAPQIAEELYAVVRDAQPQVRHAGIIALGSVGSQSTLRILLDLVRIESEPANVQAIFDSLRALTGQKFGNTAEEWEAWLSAGS